MLFKESHEFYGYTPNKGAALTFALLFGVLAFAIAFLVKLQCSKNMKEFKEWKFMKLTQDRPPLRLYSYSKLAGTSAPIFIGCVMEVIGYAARAYSGDSPNDLTPYIIQAILLLIAPAFHSATIYMVFGNVAYLLFAEDLMVLPSSFAPFFFVMGDVLGFLLQAIGGGMMVKISRSEMGMRIAIGGIFVQVAIFSQFLLSEFFFLSRVYRISSRIPQLAKSFVLLNNALLVGSIFIFIRSLVRAIEYIQGYDGAIIKQEWFLYVFDALPMFLATLLYTISLSWKSIFRVQKESVEAQLSVHPTYPNTIHQEKYYDTNVYKF